MMRNNILSHSGDNASKMRKLGGDKTHACYTSNATPARGKESCKSPTTGEVGNCCASGDMNLDVVRSIPNYKAHGDKRPICYYEGGA
jgi:hypothetical protein